MNSTLVAFSGSGMAFCPHGCRPAALARPRPPLRAGDRRARRSRRCGATRTSTSLTHANRTRARLTEVAEGLTQEWLHVLNLPAEQRRPPAARAARARRAAADRAREGPGAARRRRRSGRLRTSDGREPHLNPTSSRASDGRSSARSCARGTGSASSSGASKPRVGATPKDVVWRRDRAELWRYRGGPDPLRPAGRLRPQPRQPQLHHGSPARAAALSSSCSTRDSTSTCSTGASPTSGTPTTRSRRTSTSTCRARSRRCGARRGSEEVTLVGYCLGGTFAILYAAGHEDAPVRNLVLLASPMDYSEMGVDGRRRARRAARPRGARRRDRQRARATPSTARSSCRRRRRRSRGYATLLENLWNDEFVEAWQAMAQWSREQVPFPGAALRQVVDELVRRNVLMTGRMQLDGREIDFSKRSRQRPHRGRGEGQGRPAARRPSRRAGSSAIPPAARSCGSPAAT